MRSRIVIVHPLSRGLACKVKPIKVLLVIAKVSLMQNGKSLQSQHIRRANYHMAICRQYAGVARVDVPKATDGYDWVDEDGQMMVLGKLSI